MALIGISGKIGSGKDTVGKIIQIIYDSPHFNIKAVEGFLNREIYTEKDSFHIKKFADILKDIVCLLIGCTREQLEDREFKEKELGEEWWCYKWKAQTVIKIIDKDSYNSLSENQKEYWDLVKLTPRLMLQLLGTECGREIIHPNIWVNALMSRYNGVVCSKKESNDFVLAGEEKIYVKYPNWIITDVRFPNEAKAIKDRGGILIRVNRDLQCEICKQTKAERRGNLCYKITCPNGRPKHESETALDNYQDWNYVIENDTDIVGLIQKVKNILLFEGIIKEKL